ncbi:hypothetical protein EOI86_18690 [Hwanghaeella grinnelliae]|uniref:Uncharacterized protein n=1 Tax=Hwanghaeella grinnelliae TaxID=2500179 RepID=A0A3S2VN78_9PROT|nr:hypothetical protein [Hwanghaeella grinnelliae]RVU34868.1 hypothetical protein EOI86_18690 [Hwanghaeella grinnelliae]
MVERVDGVERRAVIGRPEEIGGVGDGHGGPLAHIVVGEAVFQEGLGRGVDMVERGEVKLKRK